MYKEIRFSGFGGQGIILIGYITGKAAAIFDNLHSVLTQSYGPESRGGSCSSQLILSQELITYPNITQTDILIAMSQEAYTKYQSELKPDGLMLIDEDLVNLEDPRSDIKILSIPATRIAEQLGRRIMANIVMLGFFTCVTKTVSTEAIREAIKTSVPKGTEELNLKAFQMGYDHGKSTLKTT